MLYILRVMDGQQHGNSYLNGAVTEISMDMEKSLDIEPTNIFIYEKMKLIPGENTLKVQLNN